MSDERKRLQAWKQGDWVCVENGALLQCPFLSESLDGAVQGVIITQSCDLLHPDESYVEIVILTKIDSISLQMQKGRHPRLYQFSHGENDYETSMSARAFLLREDLIAYGKRIDPPLAPEEIRMILLWMGRRYTRVALPDNLENGLKERGRKKKLTKKFKALVDIQEVYLSYRPFGIEAERYQVLFIAITDPAHFDNATACMEAVVAIYNDKESSIRAGFRVRTPDDFSLEELRDCVYFDRFNWLSSEAQEPPVN